MVGFYGIFTKVSQTWLTSPHKSNHTTVSFTQFQSQSLDQTVVRFYGIFPEVSQTWIGSPHKSNHITVPFTQVQSQCLDQTVVRFYGIFANVSRDWLAFPHRPNLIRKLTPGQIDYNEIRTQLSGSEIECDNFRFLCQASI